MGFRAQITNNAECSGTHWHIVGCPGVEGQYLNQEIFYDKRLPDSMIGIYLNEGLVGLPGKYWRCTGFWGVSEDSDARFGLMGCLGLRIAHLRILLLEACTPLNPHHLPNRDYNHRSSHVSPFGV